MVVDIALLCESFTMFLSFDKAINHNMTMLIQTAGVPMRMLRIITLNKYSLFNTYLYRFSLFR